MLVLTDIDPVFLLAQMGSDQARVVAPHQTSFHHFNILDMDIQVPEDQLAILQCQVVLEHLQDQFLEEILLLGQIVPHLELLLQAKLYILLNKIHNLQRRTSYVDYQSWQKWVLLIYEVW